MLFRHPQFCTGQTRLARWLTACGSTPVSAIDQRADAATHNFVIQQLADAISALQRAIFDHTCLAEPAHMTLTIKEHSDLFDMIRMKNPVVAKEMGPGHDLAHRQPGTHPARQRGPIKRGGAAKLLGLPPPSFSCRTRLSEPDPEYLRRYRRQPTARSAVFSPRQYRANPFSPFSIWLARAPSGVNTQPWHVHVVTGAAKEKLSAAILAEYAAATPSFEHKGEYAYYPEAWGEPYLGRRRTYRPCPCIRCWASTKKTRRACANNGRATTASSMHQWACSSPSTRCWARAA